MQADLVSALEHLTVYLVKNYAMEIPDRFFDGTEVKTAEDVVAATGIPLVEAEYRLRGRFPSPRQKDISSGSGSRSVIMGIGTVSERARMIAYGRRRMKPKKRSKE